METDKPIYYKENSVGLVIQNEKIVKTLNNYGITKNKSLIIDIGDVIKKSNMKEELIPAFLLGYFDGDGGIYKNVSPKGYIQYSCSITGTFETCTYYKTYFDNIGFYTKRHKDNKNNYTYQIGGRNMVRQGLSNIYSVKDNLTFFFKRKYSLYCEL